MVRAVETYKDDCGAQNITTRRVLFQPETERVVVGQEKKDGKVRQKYVIVKTLVKDVIFEETYDTSLKPENENSNSQNGGTQNSGTQNGGSNSGSGTGDNTGGGNTGGNTGGDNGGGDNGGGGSNGGGNDVN